VLLGEARLAAANPTRKRLASANRLVIEHGEKMSTLVRDLLDLARADESDLRGIDIDVDDLVREQARLHPAAIDTSGVHPARMVGHPGSISRVVRNLLDNAHRYLGLAIVHAIVDAHDGTTTISDSVLGGASVRVEIPSPK